MLLYVYDIKVKDKKALNAVKRRFYYNLNKIKYERKTKSIISVDDIDEELVDSFFMQFKDFIEVYKIRAQTIEKILGIE